MSTKRAQNWFVAAMAVTALCVGTAFAYGFGQRTAYDRDAALRQTAEALQVANAAIRDQDDERAILLAAVEAATGALSQIEQAFYVFFPVNNGAGGMLTVDPAGELHYATDGIERITGWSISEILEEAGRLVLIPESVRAKLDEGDALPIGKRMRFGPELGVRLKTTDGRLLPVAVDVWRYEFSDAEDLAGTWLAMDLIPVEDLIQVDRLIDAPPAAAEGATSLSTAVDAIPPATQPQEKP